MKPSRPSRRRFLAGSAAAAFGLASRGRADGRATEKKAQIAITLDLEMSRNFPTWDVTHWDFEKGNLDEATKRYAVEACRRVRARGGRAHAFVVGRVFEQESVEWLKSIAADGHPVGNHTYDHVNVKATEPDQLQFRFRRAPWLIRGRRVPEVIRENIEMTDIALQSRVGVKSDGFRTPGGFDRGLTDRPDLQRLLLELGFEWVSSKYPSHPLGGPGARPSLEVLDGIEKAQAAAQPFVYPTGLIEIPMSPISDITAFRGGRWRLEDFLEAIRRAVGWAIDHRAVFDFLGHPSCLVVMDPGFQAIDLICHLVSAAAEKAEIVGLGTIARRVKEA